MYMTGIRRKNQEGGLVYKLSYYSWESNCWFETELGNKHPPDNSSSVQTPPFPQPGGQRVSLNLHDTSGHVACFHRYRHTRHIPLPTGSELRRYQHQSLGKIKSRKRCDS